ncbi:MULTISPECIES: FAD-dependent monooxygenase [Methylobacterium]|uniref:Ubiquinone hydroxylase UbiL n=2 Tax=Methylobacterium TaxID=407 RepID=A0ABQ4SQW9_9HYPH|nr:MULTISPECIES: FAD-dependent monooxygenase [Methylobacterium]PIU04734.1 MAG: 2-octaprenyl-6-methoxyphenyl hydroxylase [Methylobacterium sp. CG09_land_8_20_14_0_10_71_15]GBU18457.1 2-octaprenyl-6-methoxyphenol hydroxylase [Methylobacterium sp.]GJE04828.1 Ubiquinone hydroxylase UbiL [Methylobacterium jeotgali]
MAEAEGRGGRHVVVAGAGIAALGLALALKRANGPALAVSVFDPGLPEGASRHRGRAYAVAAGGRRMLERIGIWDRIGPATQAITDMAISDSRLRDPVRPVFLTFEREGEAEPFAHMVEAGPLVAALLAACAEAGVALDASGIASVRTEAGAARVALSDGRSLRAELVVAADGARSRLREAAGIGFVTRAYDQQGIVATIGHARSHEGRAFEHFLPSGPFAILPLADGGALGHRSSIVWTERADEAGALLAGDPEEVLAEIERRFTPALGRLSLEDGPSAHPLHLGLARRYRAGRLALLSDAAHVIHPLAGQGLNLGLAAAACLAEGITDALRLGLDPGGEDVLAAYERSRRFDALAMAAATDGLNRLFSNDLTPLRLVRDFGLGLVDRMPGLKRALIAEAAAARGPQPRLMRGEPL